LRPHTVLKMNEQLTITQNKFDIFPTTSRVWVYQSKTAFLQADIPKIRQHINIFTQQWASHNRALQATGDVLHSRFIVLMVDESQAGASGCSIDSSVHFIKEIEQAYKVDLFDRMTFTYEKDNTVHAIDREQFSNLYASGDINDDTIVFDNLVNTKANFDQRWKVRLGDSWHKRMV